MQHRSNNQYKEFVNLIAKVIQIVAEVKILKFWLLYC
jgi:hypothetical protein